MSFSVHHDPESETSVDCMPSKRKNEVLPHESKRTKYNIPYKRDEQYYLDDGSCVLLIEDILFNVSALTSAAPSALKPIASTGPSNHAC